VPVNKQNAFYSDRPSCGKFQRIVSAIKCLQTEHGGSVMHEPTIKPEVSPAIDHNMEPVPPATSNAHKAEHGKTGRHAPSSS